MGVFILAGIVILVLLVAARERWLESRRRGQVAALLADSRYGEVLELLWNRGGPTSLVDAVQYLEQCGVARDDAIANLGRILGLDPIAIPVGSGEGSPSRAAVDPWNRRPTPAISSAMLLPRQ